LDGKILARAVAALDDKRRLREETYNRRLRSVYARAPAVRALDAELAATMAELASTALSSGGVAAVEGIRVRNLALQERRLAEIARAGFAADYLDDGYMCPRCSDTGYVGADICDCLMELYRSEQRDSLSNLLKLGDETFDSFKLSYYDDVSRDPNAAVSPRRSMEIIYKTCVKYARKFGKNSVNLFFNGPPGLGKTFLSACIARVVADNGYSVVYDTAVSVFAKFEEARFSRGADVEDARREIARYLECDLFILDDLGTEMTTAFTVSALYELVNTRLVAGRKTIVSSNLAVHELGGRYSEQIASRLGGEYQVLTFRGDDIRRKKNAV
jgi:DNA replication protein DnaC